MLIANVFMRLIVTFLRVLLSNTLSSNERTKRKIKLNKTRNITKLN